MADETQTAGTPGNTGEGGTASAAGTPPVAPDGGTNGELSADERAEFDRLREAHQQSLGEKEVLERLKQENQWLMEQAQRANPPATGNGYAAPTLLQERFAAVSQQYPEVAEVLQEFGRATQQELNARDAKNRYREELASVPTADRAEVDRIARDKGIWPSLALDSVKARRLDKRENDLAEQSRKLAEERDRLARGVTRTDAAPAPPASKGDEITSEENDRLIAAAERGDSDARKKLRDVDSGKVRITFG